MSKNKTKFYSHLAECNGRCPACPFDISEYSEMAQNLGCLPSPESIRALMSKNHSNWSCHEDNDKLCAGYVAYCKDNNLMYKNLPLFKSVTYLETGEELVHEMSDFEGLPV